MPAPETGKDCLWPTPKGMLARIVECALVAGLYVVLGKQGLLLAGPQGLSSPVWPASGLAIAACLLGGKRLLTCLWLGSFIANCTTPAPFWVAALISFSNTLEALLGCLIIENARERFHKTIQFGEALGIITAALLASLPAAGLGVTFLSFHAPFGPPSMGLVKTWWAGDGIGILTVLPALLSVGAVWHLRRRPTRKEIKQALIILLISAIICWLSFFKSFGSGFLFTAGPLLMLTVAWFGSPGVKLCALAISSFSIFATAFGHGPFAGPDHSANLLHLQVFLAVTAITAMALPLLRTAGDLRLPGLILFMGWGLSAWIVSMMQAIATQKENQEFFRLTGEIRVEIQQRLGHYEDLLRGGQGLLAAMGDITRKAWYAYAQSIDLSNRYPGATSIGFIQQVEREALDDFVETRHRDGVPSFSIKPVANFPLRTAGPLYVISVIEPALANAPALGLDIATEPVRRQTAENARDSGMARMSGKIRLLREDVKNSGFLFLVPLYREGSNPVEERSRQEALKGWLFTACSSDAFFNSIMERYKNQIELHLYEGDEESPASLIYEPLAAPDSKPVTTVTSALEIGGKRCIARWSRPPSYSRVSDDSLGLAVGSLSIISLLLAGIVMSIQTTGSRAREIAVDLTRELQLTKSGLEDALRFQNAVLNGTSYCIIATQTNGIIQIFNEGAQKLLGYSGEEIVGIHSPLRFHDESEVIARTNELSSVLGRTIPVGFESFTTLAMLGQVDQREWTYVCKDGSRIPVQLSINALRDASGTINGFLGIAYDLRERKQAEEQLRAAHSRLISIFETISEGLILMDEQGAILECNRSAEVILNLNRDQMTGRTLVSSRWSTIREDGSPLPPGDNPAAVSLRTKQPQQGVIIGIRRPQGELTWISINTQPLLTADGSLKGVVSSFVDITQSREQDRKLRASLAEVSHLRSALDEHSIVSFTDARGCLTFVNDKYCRLTKYTRAELLGQNNRLLSSGHHSREFYKDLWTTITRGHVWKGEFRNKAKDGTIYWVETTIVPFLNREGQPIQFIDISNDITARKKLDEDLSRARDQALESSRMKSEFLATMSHEIRTPMNGIIGMSGLLMDTPLDHHQRDMGRVIQSCAENLLGIINDILDFSKIESGKMSLNKGDFWLQSMVEDSIALLAAKAHSKRVELTCEMDQALNVCVHGDELRIRQVLLNLVGNAVKFTEKGEVNVNVRLMGEDNGKLHTRFLVCDTGIGIPQKSRNLLFQPFTQVDGSVTRRFGGTGLGLAISRRLVSMMNGELNYESEEGKGSVFWFDIDLEPAAGDTPAPAEPPRLPDVNILIVDDNNTNRLILAEQLKRMGLHCEEARSAEEALTILRNRPPEATPFSMALLDWCMPDMNGLELAAAIRADPRLSKLCLLMLSSASPFIDPDAITNIGFKAFLTKPVKESLLRSILANILLGPNQAPQPNQTQSATGLNRLDTHLRILMAEDNSANQSVAQMILEKMGHRVDIVENGERALERLPLEHYDLVLMDCQMPVLDGFETTRRIRSGKQPGIKADIPIIALTAYAMSEDRIKCTNAGMNDHVTKPISQTALQEAFLRCGLLTHAHPHQEPPAAPVQTGSIDAVLDMKVISDMKALPGRRGPSLLPELIESFLGDENKRLAGILELAEARKTAELAAATHRLAGSCSYLGAKDARALALSIEAATLAGKWPEALAKLEILKDLWPRLCAALIALRDNP